MNNKLIDKELENLMSPNSEKREGAYSFFLKAFQSEFNEYRPVIKNKLLSRVLTKSRLFDGIKMGESARSVVRSYSLLLGALIISCDLKGDLDLNIYRDILIEYIVRENDFREKSEDLGWVHCFAHLGDLISQIAFHDSTSNELLFEVKKNLLNRKSELETKLSVSDYKRIKTGLDYINKKLSN